MRKIVTAFIAAAATAGFMTSTVSANTWYGTGNNFGSGWVQHGNSIYGTGDNFGSGFVIHGNTIYGTGDNFGSGWIIN